MCMHPAWRSVRVTELGGQAGGCEWGMEVERLKRLEFLCLEFLSF